ncbi:MAG: NEW3 domain-containing protein [Chloroflexota bacterium]|nr:NEW3 domain-containing protein [Chloroflexota bacterium]
MAAIGLLMMSAFAFAPATYAAALSLTTPYPSVSVAPGSKVNFDITIKGNAGQQVALAVSGVPAKWKATLRGGGYVITAVQADASGQATAQLEVDVPAAATNGSTRITLVGTSSGFRSELPLTVQVTTQAGGDVTMTSDFPSLKGPSSSSFTFNLTLANDTAEDLTYAVTAVGPDGWQVTATLTGQSQAASAVVKAGSSAAISVAVTPAAQAAAASYPIDVRATVGTKTIDAQLAIEITGTNAMTLTTPDQRLSNTGSAGSTISQQLVIQNGGTDALQQVTVSATTPTDWTVTYAPSGTVASIAANGSATVTASIVPSGDAIAGDYMVTFKATSGGSSTTTSSVDIRVTIETSPLWGFLGLGLILVVLFGLWWVFQRYGRR